MVDDRKESRRLASPDEVISHLQSVIAKGDDNQSEVARLTRMVLEDGQWHEFNSVTGVTRTHGSFRDFVTAKRYDGLGTTKEALVAWIAAEDERLAKDVERAWREDVAPALKSAGRPSANASATCNSGANGNGNASADSILARLKRDDPITAHAVINGDLTANAAARMKGWRKPRILLTSPEPVAQRIREHFTNDEIQELIDLLQGESA